MNHQRFEGWLLSDEPLDEEQEAALQAHLETCERCPPLLEAWKTLRAGFSGDQMQAPAEGFVLRWQARLSQQREVEQRRQAWLLLGVNLAFAVATLILLGFQVLPTLPSPTEWVISWAEGFTEFLTLLEVITSLGASLFGALPGLVPPFWGAAIFVSLTSLVVLWIITLRQYALPQGVHHESV